MKTKILSKLPSMNALLTRTRIISGKIDACEGGIPEEFWCDNCKRLLKKIESLKQKIEDIIDEENSAYKVSEGVGIDSYTSPTPTYRYKCTCCDRVFVNDKHLWPPLGTYIVVGKIIRCAVCDGVVCEIKTQ